MDTKTDIKRWVVVFRTLANINRLKIIKMLGGGRKMTVTEISVALEISLKATSNHLIIMSNLDVLDAKGSEGHVFYSLNINLPKDFNRIIKEAAIN